MDAPGNDGNTSMLEQVNRPNPWRKMMMMMIKCQVIPIKLNQENDMSVQMGRGRNTEVRQE